MKVMMTFKNIKHTKALDEKIKEKSEKLKKYFEGNVNVQWSCSAIPMNHVAEIKVVGPHFTIFAAATDDNLYKCLDKVLDKAEIQLQRKKDKTRTKIHGKEGMREISFKLVDPILDEVDFEFEEDILRAA